VVNDRNADDAVGRLRLERQRQAITPSDLEPAAAADGQQAGAVVAAKLKINNTD